MKRYFSNINSLFILSLFLWASCNPTGKLAEGEYLLNKNNITRIPGIEKAEIESYIKQKPNREILGVLRFHLAIHNVVNQEKTKKKRILRDKKNQKKKSIRNAKGKKPKDKKGFIIGEWLLNIGEAPVVLDSALTEKSAKQIKLFLNNKGYFNSSVKDSIALRNKKANVFYTIDAHKPYTIRNVNYVVEDSAMAYFVFGDTSNTRIKKGQNYDVDEIQYERERITRGMRDNGYYFFSKEFIYFKVDSNLNSNQVDITIAIKKFVRQTSTIDSVTETNHIRYSIHNIFVQTDFNPIKPGEPSRDTLLMEDYYFIFNEHLEYKPKVILAALLMQHGKMYSQSDAEDTYRRLSELRSFKSINILFREISSSREQLDCYIQLSPVLKQAFAVETEGTNTSGNLGIAGSLVYQNKNVLKGAEIIEIKLKGALEAQKQINEPEVNGSNNELPFNIIEFGPEATLNVPRPLFPFSLFHFSKNASPKTVFTSAVNYQQRPDYTRSMAKLSFGLNYKETQTKRHIINPLEINLVKVDLKPAFADALYKRNNKVLLSSYSDHLVTSSSWSYVINTQDINKRTDFYYLRINAESSGNILRGINNLLHSPKVDSVSYQIIDIRYSQYLRLDFDYRFYWILSKESKLVFRGASGVGKPLHNLRVLPFEKGFFAGGSNGIRAWTARSLGPGSYSNISRISFDQIGDAQMEGNIEYRFNLFKMLNGAFFVDMGNIWLRKADPNRPGGEFKLDTFYKEIAIGTGVGARVDFSFFVLRLDMGMKVRDPMFGESGRWVITHINDKKWKNNHDKYSFLNLNLGIGYPF